MKTMSIPDFMQRGWQEERMIDAVIAHCRRHRIKYQVIGFTLLLFIGLTDQAFAGTGIDEKANSIYKKLVKIGKWVIVAKGGMETIKNAADGDFDSAKKKFLGYLVVYALLWGLPWAMDQVEGLFDEVGAT